jgi:hypothetical protein
MITELEKRTKQRCNLQSSAKDLLNNAQNKQGNDKYELQPLGKVSEASVEHRQKQCRS